MLSISSMHLDMFGAAVLQDLNSRESAIEKTEASSGNRSTSFILNSLKPRVYIRKK